MCLKDKGTGFGGYMVYFVIVLFIYNLKGVYGIFFVFFIVEDFDFFFVRFEGYNLEN